jgi:hypothetical protein
VHDRPREDPGLEAARDRLDEVLEALGRVDLQLGVVSAPDATRLAARERAVAAATAAGRGSLLAEARTATRDAVVQAFARAGFSGTWAFTEMSMSVATADDRVATAAAFEEAAMAAIVEDLVDDETLDVLRSTSEELGGLTGMSRPGALSSLASPVAIALLAFFALGALVFALEYGPLAVAIPGVMLVAIFIGLTRRTPAS